MTMRIEYQIELSRNAQKELANIPETFRSKVTDLINKIANAPFAGKKLKGEYDGYWSMRAWPYRVIYKIKELEVVIFIIKIRHRKDVYR